MIDVHCHILPGIDDGSRSIEESMEMIREASLFLVQEFDYALGVPSANTLFHS